MAANPSPLTAPTAEDFRAWHRVQAAALAHDRPGDPIPSEDALRAELTTTASTARHVLWLVRGTGADPVATAKLRLSTAPGRRQLAHVELTVHPAHRRMGAGSRLLATVTEAATDAGCRSLAAQVVVGTSGESFLATRDFLPVLRLSWLRLALDEIPEPIAKLPQLPHPGYRLVSWEGVVPDEWAAGLVRAKQGMADMPVGGFDLGPAEWDEERIRESAEVVARRGERLLTVAAVAEADGSVAGFTELVLPADDSGVAQQYDTAALPAHRGHGLGLWMKAEMLRLTQAGHPEITEVMTDNADDNRHMLAVNTALGFRPRRRSVIYQLKLRVR
ncbi:Acetyltransferase (GNAT) family protein [Streptomyces sp. DvalAA-14]|uniref:GNAT family N-acetyltransferase n=1 Tax=unclassified Streptomyces TaxID=2593676 RepID=UPI00081B469C|nr:MULTISPECIES: GNAT family N-acetyltransferase [unclassified Streptomyces]MYS25148.1 GNAT family N-acetyltransferase [Streptomyces sp. SID4948]SCE52510.1 Acetyltransferase (GNAT) family protein [Streptomyces sp. DvalAA-14]